MKKFKKIRISGEIIEAELCDTVFKKARGLMFRKNPKPLFFVFKKLTRQPIHSFFCKPFLALWLNGTKIVDEKTVMPWKLSIVPKEEFNYLLEFPLKNKQK
jgi:uncharacterized membrane protein (UPF0127 family)